MEELEMVLDANGAEDRMELLMESIEVLIDVPLDLNSASEETLSQCGLFTPFQVFGIVKFRDKYGPFFSIYELAVLPGFRMEWLKIIAPFLSCPAEAASSSQKVVRGILLSNMAVKYPLSSAYSIEDSGTSYYAGPPWKAVQRIKLQYNDQWSASLIFEKDPGEKLIHHSRPEHLAGNIRYQSGEWLREVILGNYRLHRGLGLVNGTAFRGSYENAVPSSYQSSYVKPYASGAEYDYYRGTYASIKLREWKADIFWSLKPEDLSFYRYSPGADLFSQKRSTGYHRSKDEINGKDLARQHSGGLSISRSAKWWNSGVNLVSSRLSIGPAGLDSLDSEDALFTNRANLSLFGILFNKRFESFAEIAVNEKGRKAILTGTHGKLNPAISISALWRWYEPGYSGQAPSALSASSYPENESGLYLSLQLDPGPGLDFILSSDISRKLDPTGSDDNPGYSMYHLLKIRYAFKEDANIEFKLVSGIKQEPNIQQAERRISYSSRQHLRLHLHYRLMLSHHLLLQGRLATAFHPSEQNKSPGTLLYQQLSTHISPALKITYRFTLFDSDTWDKRIYTYEPGVRYSFSFPVFHGKGSRNLLVFSLKAGHNITLRSKVGITEYAHRWSTGSAYDERKGKEVWDAELQLEMKF
jgi:hypothetical protein